MGRKMTKYNPGNDPLVAQLYKDGWSLHYIAVNFECHHETIKRRLKIMGVPVRNKSAAMFEFHKKNRESKNKLKGM